ncbi:MAG TPA: 2'-O-glycosyltransferase CruG [Elainellaceae cyanobacterium]
MISTLTLLLSGCCLILISLQIPAVAIWLARLLRGAFRHPPLVPQHPTPDLLGTVSIVVPTLNEAERIGPCLAGLSLQSYEVREIIVVDSHSEDGTVDQVKSAQRHDPRIRLIFDEPLPTGWVGRPWALHTGFLHSSEQSEWVLGIDADTRPQPNLVASLVLAAQSEEYDLVSLSPRFILKTPGEFWLQPALLMTLIYRFGASGESPGASERIMANGQCFLCRRSRLVDLDGYTHARHSFCDDVTLARYAARQGARVGFLDGARLISVRMYEGAVETWREWGRSLDLKDAGSIAQTWGDVGFLIAVQGVPLMVTLGLAIAISLGIRTPFIGAALGINGGLVAIRFALLGAIASSYDWTAGKAASWAFWLSPLADPLAVYRIFLSARQTPTQWRGRTYHS